MTLQTIKRIVSLLWVSIAVAVGMIAGVNSSGALTALVALGALPPLALLLLWNDPTQTMSESIREGLR